MILSAKIEKIFDYTKLFLKQTFFFNPYYPLFIFDCINGYNQALVDYIEANRKEYERLLKDENYTDVRFNPINGALSAIHKDHRFDSEMGIFGIERGEYERISLNVLYEYGQKVVLGSEKQEYKIKMPDGELNDKKFDIKGVEGIGKNNIINDIKDANKKVVETIVFYQHDRNLFDEGVLRGNYVTYLRNSNNKRIQNVYYIVDKKLFVLKIKNADDKSPAK